VSKVRDLGDAHVLCSGDNLMAGVPGWETLRAAVWRTRGFGDFWQHMLVAQGAAELAIDPVVAEYDIAAPTLIVEEAGGRVTDLAGVQGIKQPAGYSSNGVLHDEVLAILRAE
jgi:histidinol-phosphatase